MSNMGTVDLAYFAGLVDGEGSFCIGAQSKSKDPNKKPYLRPVLSISMCDQEALLWVMKTFPNFKYYARIKPTIKGSRRTFTCVMAKYDSLKEFLPVIIPYLKVKKQHAKILLEFVTLYGQRKGSHKELPAAAYQLRGHLSAMNRHQSALL